MSVKFEKETVRTAPVPGAPAGKEDTMHKIGEAITGGKGQTGYLAVRAMSIPKYIVTMLMIIPRHI